MADIPLTKVSDLLRMIPSLFGSVRICGSPTTENIELSLAAEQKLQKCLLLKVEILEVLLTDKVRLV
jgi:hypothetical protein